MLVCPNAPELVSVRVVLPIIVRKPCFCVCIIPVHICKKSPPMIAYTHIGRSPINNGCIVLRGLSFIVRLAFMNEFLCTAISNDRNINAFKIKILTFVHILHCLRFGKLFSHFGILAGYRPLYIQVRNLGFWIVYFKMSLDGSLQRWVQILEKDTGFLPRGLTGTACASRNSIWNSLCQFRQVSHLSYNLRTRGIVLV